MWIKQINKNTQLISKIRHKIQSSQQRHKQHRDKKLTLGGPHLHPKVRVRNSLQYNKSKQPRSISNLYFNGLRPKANSLLLPKLRNHKKPLLTQKIKAPKSGFGSKLYINGSYKANDSYTPPKIVHDNKKNKLPPNKGKLLQTKLSRGKSRNMFPSIKLHKPALQNGDIKKESSNATSPLLATALSVKSSKADSKSSESTLRSLRSEDEVSMSSVRKIHINRCI